MKTIIVGSNTNISHCLDKNFTKKSFTLYHETAVPNPPKDKAWVLTAINKSDIHKNVFKDADELFYHTADNKVIHFVRRLQTKKDVTPVEDVAPVVAPVEHQ